VLPAEARHVRVTIESIVEQERIALRLRQTDGGVSVACLSRQRGNAFGNGNSVATRI
jgi:hypothetical protein